MMLSIKWRSSLEVLAPSVGDWTLDRRDSSVLIGMGPAWITCDMKQQNVSWVKPIGLHETVITVWPRFIRSSHKPGPGLVLDLGRNWPNGTWRNRFTGKFDDGFDSFSRGLSGIMFLSALFMLPLTRQRVSVETFARQRGTTDTIPRVNLLGILLNPVYGNCTDLSVTGMCYPIIVDTYD